MQCKCRILLHLISLLRVVITGYSLFTICTSYAYDGEVNVSGKITANTCTVSTRDMTVDMGKVNSADFQKGRDPAGLPAIPFSITLEGCNGIASGVRIGFYGKPDTNKPDIYALDEGGATGIGIQLMDDDRTQIPVNTLSKFYPLDAQATDVALQFYAHYTADGTTVQVGRADSTVAFLLTYD
ncbi:fimbrial protein [Klebsiella aerogenes]|uniref:fimbrial protein n=1 Tax=Klebsiella aerogenes TaxID=548 RepID=UPI0022EC522F|nr:fimbrial protein [Klebsiella aerogenes]MDA3990628.1 fimbrial protein [Klebsiella aerogenes]